MIAFISFIKNRNQSGIYFFLLLCFFVSLWQTTNAQVNTDNQYSKSLKEVLNEPLEPLAHTGASGADSCPALVRVPAGTFAMGTDDPRGYVEDGEGPAHQVHLSPYAIGMHAVTNHWFARFVADSDHVTTAERLGDSFVFGGLVPRDLERTPGRRRSSVVAAG